MSFRSLSIALLAALPGTAAAQAGYSIDSEFVRPTFGDNAFSSVSVADQRKAMAVRAGLITMYTRNPVTLYNRLEDTEIGAVVANRATVMAGASLDLSERVTLDVMVPVGFNGAGEVGDPKDFEAPGAGLSDIGIGGHVTAVRTKVFGLGFRGGLIFPSGRADAYLGDDGFRPHVNLLTHLQLGRTLIASDAGLMLRPSVIETDEDFVRGSEINWNVGLRHKLPDATRLAFTGQVMTRAGFSNFLGGGAENALEGLAGIEVYPHRNVTLDISAGRGLTEGYATTDLRVLGGLKVQIVPPEEPELLPLPPEPPKVIPPPPLPIEEPDPPEETETIVYYEDRIVFKEQPGFVVGTTQLLDQKSKDMVRDVAEFVRDKWQIAHIVIEGHASIEGSYEYNYNLSQGRARAIWEAFVKAGVHPDRVSFRGRGEVVPIRPGATEEELQKNRRIEFYVTHQLNPAEDESPEIYKDTSVKAPWSGQVIRVQSPEKPIVEDPNADKDKTIFDIDDDIGIGDDEETEGTDTGETGDTGDGGTPAPEGGDE